MVTRHYLADIALKEVGVVEVGGNNRGERIREYQKATWLDPDKVDPDDFPWCSAFVCYCVKELQLAGFPYLIFPRISLPTTPSAFGLEKWAKNNNLLILPKTAPAERGDIAIFDMSHCGIVIEDRGGYIDTVEGNTSPAGGRESNLGDGVWRKTRKRSMFRSFIRLEKA